MKLNEEKEKNKQFKNCYKFSSKDKLISIEITSYFQDIEDFHIIAKDTELFSNIEKILYKFYPEYEKTNNFFLYGGATIDRNKTLKENNIDGNSQIIIKNNDFE